MAGGALSRLKEVKEQGCGGCKTLEEEFYWKHVKSLRFCVVLAGDFQQNLPIPKKFADNMKPTILHPKMTLRGPSGASWDVVLITRVDGMFLKDGWEEFVKAYSLQENDILFFKYDRHSSFNVKIFDGECEKEAAYFVRKCDNLIPAIKNQKKRVSSDIVQEDDDDSDGVCITNKKARVDVVTEPVNERKHGYHLRCRLRTSKKIVTCKPVKRAINVLRKKVALRSSKKLQGPDSHDEPEVAKQPDQNGPSNKEVPSADQNLPEVNESCPPDAAFEKAALHGKRGRPRKKQRALAVPAEPEVAKQPDQNGPSNKEVPSVGQNPPEVNESWPPEAAFEKAALREKRGRPRKKQTASAAEPGAAKQPDQNGPTNNEAPSVDQNPPEVNETCPPDAAVQKVSLHETRGRKRNPSCSKKQTTRAVECYISNRRPITELEKREALKMASERLTEKSFFVVMRACCCYKCFLMTIPAKWATEYLGARNHNVILRVGDKIWFTRFTFSRGVLGPGWKQFALENNLEEFDVCLFKLVSQDYETVVLDVTIFRVVEEVTPPTLSTASILSA